jgi:hypothetical protein
MAGLYPHLLSYYSEGVGGLRGATSLGLETTYWSETIAEALPYINSHAQSGDSIWFEDSDVLVLYQKIGLLRQDVRILKVDIGEFEPADWYILQYSQSFYGKSGEEGYLPLQMLKTQMPVYKVSYQGIPLMEVYDGVK